MLFLLLSFSASYNIRRGNCEVLIDEYYYNLSDFQGIDPLIHRGSEFYYFIRLCAPPLDKIEKDFDVFLIQTSLSTSKMVNVITQNSFDYRPLNTSNFEEGIIYYADSEPFESPLDGSIRTLDLEFRIKCDASVKEINPEYLISDSLTAGKIIVSFPHKAGCVKSHQPTPTPTPLYEPDCEYVDRLDNETSRGIWADLNFMNDGPYGIKSIHTIDGNDYYLYFQPCERIQCPPNFICDDEGITYSSAWLCNSSLHCISYGVSTESYSFRPIDGDLTKGMQLIFEESNNKRSIELSLTCNSTFPEGHVKWKSEVHFEEDKKVLKVDGETNEICIVPIPTVTPSPDRDFCKFEDTVGDYYVQIDLQKYNNDGQNGWKSVVDVMAGHDSYPKSQLLFKPCGNITCPPDAFCNGDEDAEIWLCHEVSGTLECEGYGLYKNKVTLELYDDDDIKDGIQANYLGDGKRKANVIYLCNESLSDGEILMPDSVNLNYRSISFYIYAKDACAKSNPTKTEIPTLVPPTKTEMPTLIPPTTTPDDEKDRKYFVNGGSIFLLLLTIGGVFYISIGTLINFIRSGQIEIPNHEFWTEFSVCIETAVLYIISCGKKSTMIANYENIQ